MNHKPITLDEFLKLRRQELEKFEANWTANALIDPDKWPTELLEGEWFEQEAAYGQYSDRHD